MAALLVCSWRTSSQTLLAKSGDTQFVECILLLSSKTQVRCHDTLLRSRGLPSQMTACEMTSQGSVGSVACSCHPSLPQWHCNYSEGTLSWASVLSSAVTLAREAAFPSHLDTAKDKKSASGSVHFITWYARCFTQVSSAWHYCHTLHVSDVEVALVVLSDMLYYHLLYFTYQCSNVWILQPPEYLEHPLKIQCL